MTKTEHINISKIIPPEHDSRIHTNEEADNELLESVRSLGVLLPLIVKKAGKSYEIIAGNRRFKAAIKAGLPAVPCIIADVTGKEADLIKIHENIKRLPLGHIEQGTFFLYLRNKYVLSEAEIGELIGKSIPYISQHLTLLDSDSELVTAVHTGILTFSVAREIMTLKNASDRKCITTWAVQGGASVDVVKNWVNEAKRQAEEQPPDQVHTRPSLPPVRRSLPVFECCTCLQTIPINEMRIMRVCPVCEHAVMSEIEQEKLKLAQNTPEEG